MASDVRRSTDPDDNDEYQHRTSRWRVQKEISIPTLVLLGANIITCIWWAATMAGRVEQIEKSMQQSQTQQSVVDSRQDADALRAETRISAQIERLGAKLDRLVESSAHR